MTIKGYRTFDPLKSHCPKPRNCLRGKGPTPITYTEPAYYFNEPYAAVDPYTAEHLYAEVAEEPYYYPEQEEPSGYYAPDYSGDLEEPMLDHQYEV